MTLVLPLLFPGMTTGYIDSLWFTPFCFHAFAVLVGTLLIGWKPTKSALADASAARARLESEHEIGKDILDFVMSRAQNMGTWARLMTWPWVLALILAAAPNGLAEVSSCHTTVQRVCFFSEQAAWLTTWLIPHAWLCVCVCVCGGGGGVR